MGAHAAEEDDSGDNLRGRLVNDWLALDMELRVLREHRANTAIALLPLIPPGGEVRTEQGTVTRQMVGGQSVLRRT